MSRWLSATATAAVLLGGCLALWAATDGGAAWTAESARRLDVAERPHDLPDATLRDALTALARERPALVGKVVDETGGGLLEGYALNVNGAEFVADLGAPVREGDAVLVLSAEAGG